jgi:hypothetical protein
MKPATRVLDKVTILALSAICLMLFFSGLDTEMAILKSEVEGIRVDVANVKMRLTNLEAAFENGTPATAKAKPSKKNEISDEELAKRRLAIHMEDPETPAIKVPPRGFQFVDPDFYIGNVILAARSSRVTTLNEGENSGTGEHENYNENVNKNNPDDPYWQQNSGTKSHHSTSKSKNEHRRIEHTNLLINGEVLNRSRQDYKSAQFIITLYDRERNVLGHSQFSVGYLRSATSLPFRAGVDNVERREVHSFRVVFLHGQKQKAGKPTPKDHKAVERMREIR